MKRLLAFAIAWLLLGPVPVYADTCPGVQLPPPPYDRTPNPYPVVEFEDGGVGYGGGYDHFSKNVTSECKRRGFVVSERSILSCTRTNYGVTRIILPKINWRFDKDCQLRLLAHELGCVNGWPSCRGGN